MVLAQKRLPALLIRWVLSLFWWENKFSVLKWARIMAEKIKVGIFRGKTMINVLVGHPDAILEQYATNIARC